MQDDHDFGSERYSLEAISDTLNRIEDILREFLELVRGEEARDA